MSILASFFPKDREAYNTHLNYINCLSSLLENCSLKSNLSLSKLALPDIDTKKNLITLTKKSLTDERKIVEMDKDYSYASTSWLPIKSYYLIFNIQLTIEYILKVQKGTFRMGHLACVEEYTRKLKSGEIEFSEPVLNQVFDQAILSFKSTSGANLSGRTSADDMYKFVMRKIAMYKLEDWKQKNKIDLRKQLHKKKCQQYLSSFSVSIFDFPYFMRIRSNYRDFAFIESVTTSETAVYFSSYFTFTARFVMALEKLRLQLLTMRK